MRYNQTSFLMKAGRAIFLFSLAVPALAAAGAAGFQKKYFAATKPGAWAKYSMTVGGKTESVYLYTRLPDDKGFQRLRLRTDFTSGANKGIWSISDYWLKSGFALEEDALDYGRATENLTLQSRGSKKTRMTADMLEAMVKDMPDYSKSAVFVSTEKVKGLICDHYTYTEKHGNPEQTETGELWLNETVPFGMVRQRAAFTDATGKPISDYEMNLLSSSVKAPAPAKASTK
jgi:hypothetical protein